MSLRTKEAAWELTALGLKHDNSNVAKSILLMKRGFEITRVYGDALPLAVDIGEGAFEPAVFMQLRPVEQQTGKLLDYRT